MFSFLSILRDLLKHAYLKQLSSLFATSEPCFLTLLQQSLSLNGTKLGGDFVVVKHLKEKTGSQFQFYFSRIIFFFPVFQVAFHDFLSWGPHT